jgi:MYXO-CTERM domain-containing protein
MKFTLLAVGALFLSMSAQATSLSLDFTSSGGVDTGDTGGAFGNVRTYTNDGVTVTVTAWGLTGHSDTTFQTANLGQYTGTNLGLGVCNQEEGKNCDSPNHQVDNANGNDFVLFQFSSVITSPITITITPYGTYDRDVTYYTGNAASGLNLTGDALSSLSAAGLSNMQNSPSTVSSSPRTVTLTLNGGINSILFGAAVDGDSHPDYFKINGLTANVAAAPEPATSGLAGATLIALAALARRVNRRR